jgi:rod shape determining protein RodA
MRKDTLLASFDWITISLYAALVIIGWLMIYASEYNPQEPTYILDFGTSAGKQFFFIFVAILVGIMAMVVEGKFYSTFAFGIYIVAIGLLVLVFLFAPEVNGARAWFEIGSFKFQPSEFGKVATALALAHYMGSYNFNINDNKSRLRAVGIILLPMILILMQKDAGSMLVYSSLFIVLFRAGMPAIIYASAIAFGLLSMAALVFPTELLVVFLALIGSGFLMNMIGFTFLRGIIYLVAVVASIVLYSLGFGKISILLATLFMVALAVLNMKPKWQVSAMIVLIVSLSSAYAYSIQRIFTKLPRHQQERFLMWLKPSECDPQGSIMNLNQSINAIGSGGLTGKGYLQGELIKLGFVSEDNTDFIFCSVGEEHGFLGSLILVSLFVLLIMRIIFIAERQRSGFSKYYAYGIASIMFYHFFINIGMTIGLMPIIGIPLPFVSYGGSSLISFTIMLAVLLKIDSSRLLVFR